MNEIRSSYPLFGGESDSAPAALGKSLSLAARELAGLIKFSTPGHKGALNAFDITEYDENSLFPADGVTVAERRAAEFYGVKRARLLTGGASMGIKAAFLALGRDVVAPEFTHRSAFEGARLAGKAIFTFNTGEERGLPLPPTAADYERAFDRYPGAGAALVTSPDYFGRVAPVEEIAAVCRRRGKAIIADCAHGAHFAARSDLFPAGGERYADFAVMSAHKTMRALTMGAVGAVNAEEYFSRYDDALALLGTSSPSYPILMSVDEAIAFERAFAARYDGLIRACNSLRGEVKCLPCDDPLRITADCAAYGLTGREMFYALKERGILAETFLGGYCVFIVTLSDTPQGVDGLAAALKEIIKEHSL